MPAACTLLLLLGLVPPAGSLPLASPRRRLLPPPPPPPPPPTSRSRLGRPCSPPAAGHAGSPVIESSHQARSSDMEIRTSDALVDSMELVTMLAGSREQALLPARHGAVPAASGVTEHISPTASGGDFTPPGAGPPDSPSARTATHLPTRSHPPAAGSHHHAAGSQERGKRALASPGTPAAAERTPQVLASISTDSAERTLGRRRVTWDVAGFDNVTRVVLPPSSAETRPPGTGGPSRQASSWAGMELHSSPPVGTVAASPSPSGNSGGMLQPLPSTSLPGSPGQPQSSSRASSTQTGANRMALHLRDVTGDSTSPLLTALPATDSTFRAAGSSSVAAENPRSGIQRAAPGSAVHPPASAPSSVAPAWGRFLRPSTEHRLAPSHPAPESTAAGELAVGSSYQPSDVSDAERRVSDFPTTSTSISITATKGGGRTLRSLPASTRLADAAEISTAGTEITSSSDRTWSPGMSLGAQGGGSRGATDPLLTGSLSASESASTTEGTSAVGGRLRDAPLTSMPSSMIATSGGERSPVPVSDTHAASSMAGNSATALPCTSSLDVVLLPSSSATEPGRQSDVSQSGARLGELPTKPLPAFSPSISVPLPSPSASERGRRVSGAPTETTYVSTTLSSHKEGTSQAAANRGMWSTAAESPTSHPDMAGEPRTGPFLSSTAWPGAGHISSGRAAYPEPKVTLSSRVSTYFSAAGEPSTVSSSHHSLSSLSAEERMSSPISDPAYSSSMSAGGGERTLHLVTDGTLAGGTESSTSYTKTTSSPGPAQPVSVEQSGMTNASTSSGGFAGFATETLFTQSSKIPTYSSFQNDLTSFSSSHQPISSIDAEKRASVSHTDGTYISTTYTRGGERTLLSISNSSISADSSESSTFFSEITNPSDSSKSSVAQDRRSNVSSDGDFVEPSTEPLLVHSSKLLTSASAGSVQNTTLFNTDSELLTTGRSSLSSSAFPASSSLSSLHHSLSSTPPPTYLFTSSESSEPLSSSVMASSPPLQALSSSLPTSSLLSPSYSLASLLPLFSSPSSVSQSNDSDQASTSVATTVVRRVPSTAAVAGSLPRGTNKHNVTHQPQNSTTFTSTGSPLSTAPMEQLGGHIISVSAPAPVTETASPRAATSQEGSFGKATPLLTTASDAPWAGPTDAPLSPSPSATKHSVIVPVVALTTVKPSVLTTPASRWPTPGDASTMKARRAQTPTATKHAYTTGESTEAVDPTTARPGKVTEENVPVTSPSEAPPTSKTTVSIATTLAAAKPTTIPPSSSTAGLRMSSPATDVDKCLSNPCPALATCNNTHGSYICQCPLGYELEKGKCNLVRIFIGQVPLKLNITHGKYTELLHVEGEILAMLDASLSGLPGYHHSTVKATREANFVHVSVQSTFSLASNVTFYDIASSVKSYIRACKYPTEACQFISSLKPLHRVGSLCKQKDPECDKETSECTDFDGVALCQCKSGYFKYNKMDHSCRACEDGYKLENETCVSCPFGLGGFNCGNPYQLITVVIAAAGGGLLLIMGIALIVTCCRKNKNDISKLIFKSGDFQMSPYAEYPKNPRAQEWGRETIEMQENGSTKNLLQMTDVYYSPTGLRNPELERNGLYPPYTGLPGSRHSCIYPGQYNPSFISDETRRRDYF
ncbi:protein HEG homolog 1 isoform 4-T4 [Spheniscus humboldti]